MLQVVTKPTGPVCNIACEYCFYLEKEAILSSSGKGHTWTMSDQILESYIRQKCADGERDQFFLWQGGEPTLAGLAFFRKVVNLQAKYGHGLRIHNALQTNGILIDDAWASFLRDQDFLVGLSIDGPRELNDTYRKTRQGKSSFDQTRQGLERLQAAGVRFNTLTSVHPGNVEHPEEVYEFLISIGSYYHQYIPIVERNLTDISNPASRETDRLAAWSVDPEKYARFLNRIFDRWVGSDVGRVFVQNFEVALEAWLGRQSSLCVFNQTCGQAPVLEHNGDLYACDHFVCRENYLGNILESSLTDLTRQAVQVKFGNDKLKTLPQKCIQCEYRFACHGGCPKDRIIPSDTEENKLNYLCPAYLSFFAHIDQHMRFMAEEIRNRRSPRNIMKARKPGWGEHGHNT